MEPKPNTNIELTAQANYPTHLHLTVYNPSTTEILRNIEFTSKDLNITFFPNNFALDVNSTKTIIATITEKTNVRGQILLGAQKIKINVKTYEVPTPAEEAWEKYTENQSIIFSALFVLAFALIVRAS